jgi:hypothetical protein
MRKFEHRHGRRLLDDDGFALVAVLIMATIIAGISIALMLLAQEIGKEGAAVSADIETRHLAEAGVNRIILAFSVPGDPLRARLIADGRPVTWQFADSQMTLCVEAESGKLDVNAGPRDHIQALIEHLIPESEPRSNFIGLIDRARAQGEFIPSVVTLLSPFDRMTSRRDLVQKHFTVLTGQHGFDPRTAPAAIIQTAPGLTSDLKEQILTARAAGLAIGSPILGAAPSQTFVSEKPIYTVRSELLSWPGPFAMSSQIEFRDLASPLIFTWSSASPRGCG